MQPCPVTPMVVLAGRQKGLGFLSFVLFFSKCQLLKETHLHIISVCLKQKDALDIKGKENTVKVRVENHRKLIFCLHVSHTGFKCFEEIHPSPTSSAQSGNFCGKTVKSNLCKLPKTLLLFGQARFPSPRYVLHQALISNEVSFPLCLHCGF